MWKWVQPELPTNFWEKLRNKGAYATDRLILRELLAGSENLNNDDCLTMIRLYDDRDTKPFVSNPWMEDVRPSRGRFDTIDYIEEMIVTDGIKGDVIETGVWRGGLGIYMSFVFRGRLVFLADSFEGCQDPKKATYFYDKEIHYKGQHMATLADVKTNVEKFWGKAPEHIKYIVGYFQDTLINRPIRAEDGTILNEISLLRFDADTYSATLEVLNNLYPIVSPGGFVIIDDYCVETCRTALLEWLKDHPEIELCHPLTYKKLCKNEYPCGAWWRKEK